MESKRLAVLHVRLDLSTYYLPDGRLLDLEMVTTMVWNCYIICNDTEIQTIWWDLGPFVGMKVIVFDACGDPRIWVHFWVSVSSYGLEEEESNRKTIIHKHKTTNIIRKAHVQQFLATEDALNKAAEARDMCVELMKRLHGGTDVSSHSLGIGSNSQNVGSLRQLEQHKYFIFASLGKILKFDELACRAKEVVGIAPLEEQESHICT
ncbi:hypothetical protein JHK82_022767 [Glycine max]|nr:hypothetical protein JHK82_022767 [Glycine max]